MAAADHPSRPRNCSPPPPPLPPRPRPVASWILVGACAAAFLASYAFGRGLDVATLICCGAKDRDLILRANQWWRLVSAGFLHANAVHLAVNLYALLNLGPLIEGLWGPRRFLVIYTLALVGGSLASLATTIPVSVGASGAIFGLFGALAVFAIRHRRLIAPRARVPLLLNLAAILAANVALGIALPFIDNAAHAGGFAAGALGALVLRPVRVLGPSGGIAELAARVASALAVAAVVGSLIMAARYAEASQWFLIAGGEMERHTLDGGELLVSVPRGWRYEPPASPAGPHRFTSSDVAVFAVRAERRSQVQDPAAVAEQVRSELQKGGAQLLASHEIVVGDRLGVEMLFRHRTHGVAEKHRVVVFPAGGARLVVASFVCREVRYRALEVLFDKILQSIQAGQGRPPAGEAEKLWHKAIEKPGDPDAAVALAAYYTQQGRYAPAEELLRATLRRNPRHADAHDQLALLYATARAPYRKPEEAVRCARKALELKPDTPRYLGTLALAYEAAGDRANALAAARRAAALAPDDATYADLVKRLAK